MIKKLWYKILWYTYNVQLAIQYCEWNPWALARLNLAWTNYTKTIMYEKRMELDFIPARRYDNYAEQAYVENLEIKLFTSLFNWKDKLQIWLLPFSCGKKHTIPFFLIRNRIIIIIAWIIGAETEED